eukprot:CAMPEP_0175312046 /NCGR_PEP_ID=MMETSP0093-20121207/67157_1 /TAXON_ID=311494 /ORGANISM="Alexandrium monilatum, Strain CCMP3105" /LENGTH=63 /DNA_ID=CAMNT_0016608691 /DNA_START=26 /DNA_END=214 /DNA_ORIENTATION=-
MSTKPVILPLSGDCSAEAGVPQGIAAAEPVVISAEPPAACSSEHGPGGDCSGSTAPGSRFPPQ